MVPNQFGQTIKAKVTNKTDRNKKKSFSADIEDESGKIKIIGYGEETDNYFDLIQVCAWQQSFIFCQFYDMNSRFHTYIL